jgi:hypothetical protein
LQKSKKSIIFEDNDQLNKELQDQLRKLQQQNIALQKNNQVLKTQNQELNKKKRKGKVAPMPKNKQVANYAGIVAKKEIFRKIKFVADQHQLDDLSSKNTIGNKVMQSMRIPAEEQERWWETYKDDVHSALASQRSICTTYMKKAFFSELKPLSNN